MAHAQAELRVGSAVAGRPGGSWSESARRDGVMAVADAGLDHLVIGDHVSFLGGAGADGLVLAAHALGCRPDLAVYVAVYQLFLRHPVTVARQVADLAALTPGSLTLGVGLGGEDRHESEVCGIDPATRGRRTDECLAVLRGLLAGDTVTFDGREIQVSDARIRPVADAAVPVVVGGRSEAALARAARFGDGWIGIWVSAARYADAVARVEEGAESQGRTGVTWSHALNVWCGIADDRRQARQAVARGMEDLYQLPYEKFARWSPAGTPGDVADFLAPYLDAGCTTFNLIPRGPDPVQTAALAGEVRRLLMRP